MAKCNKCGKKGLFLKVDSAGICKDCASTAQLEKNQSIIIGEFEAIKANLEKQVADIRAELAEEEKLYNELLTKARMEAIASSKKELQEIQRDIELSMVSYEETSAKNKERSAEHEKLTKNISSSEKRLQKAKELLKSFKNATERIDNDELVFNDDQLISDIEEFLSPVVQLKFQCMNVRELRKEFTKNQKLISETLTKYSSRYTTKTNRALYQLMVIALEAELQNILYNIGYGKLENAFNSVSEISRKYQSIAVDGNQSIAPTVKRFIGEIEYFFRKSVEIEYEYYVQKERAKEEQRALREQMRQEAEERKELERQQKQIEKEEQKYNDEMSAVKELIANEGDSERVKQLEERLARLEEQLSTVNITKEEIIKLQTGKAGNIYIISNLGSFGDSVFKIGMTRRLDPMERVRELGDASVPFPFDVHSFVFSDDAVGLEASLHKRLNERRVNKVNRRKEFFTVPIDELEELVYDLEPTAEFNKTMLAEQYNQSLSIDVAPGEYNIFDDCDEELSAE